MLDRVRDTIRAHALAAPGEPLWVAVSGGVDSMVLLHVLRALGHPCRVAHVDHGLRGAESDADREFVRAHCMRHGIPFRMQCVDVEARAAAAGESTQMAARTLRSAWFRTLAEEGPGKVATAHHADDAIETFFLGLMRGVGARGWGGIPIQREVFIRPMLHVPRSAITAYALANGITWREDASNGSDVYLRNRIRHELLPLLDTWRPGTQRVMARNMHLFGELDHLARSAGERALEGLLPEPDGTLRIPFQRILGSTPLLVLHHVLRNVGLHPDRFEDVLTAMHQHRVGALFPGEHARVYVDRGLLVITPIKGAPRSWTFASADDGQGDAPLRLQRCAVDAIGPASADTAWLDLAGITFPLVLRPWRPGDRMRPDGLGGSKLISDILIDAKVSRDRKEHAYVLADAERIVWLCGSRVAEGVKAGPGSMAVLRVDWSPV